MKSKKTLFFVCISIFVIGFLLTSFMTGGITTSAYLEETTQNNSIDSYDLLRWRWTTTEVVSTESTGNSYTPSLAVDTAGNVHIAWYDLTDYAGAGTDLDIFYKRWVPGSGWIATEVVSTESTSLSSRPSLAVDSAGNVHVAWEDMTDYAGAGTDRDIFYKRWVPGSGWIATEVVSTESTSDSYIPSLAVDSVGNVHIAWYDQTDYAGAGTDADIFYKRWVPGSGWIATEVVSTESTGHSSYPSLAVDTAGNVHIAWYDGTDYAGAGTDTDIFYKRWVPGWGWIATEVVSTESTSDSYSPSLAVDTAGNVHIAWEDWTDYAGAGTDRDIFYKRWVPGSGWIATEVVSTESTSDSFTPSLAVDTAGNVHVAWDDYTDYAGAGTDTDIFYKKLYPLLDVWTTTEIVSTESTGNSFTPSLAVDTAGNVHVAWEDSTDYDGAGTDQDIFYKMFTGPPAAPELAFIIPNPTESNVVGLEWNNVFGASNYYVYRSTSYIWTVDSLTPLTNVSTNYYVDILSAEGIYSYVIVAENDIGNSSHSNCQYVEYKLPSLAEIIIPVGIFVGFSIVAFLIVLKKKKNTH